MSIPSYTNDRRFTNVGKEVLLDGEHYADAVSVEAAVAISDACEFLGLDMLHMPIEAVKSTLGNWV